MGIEDHKWRDKDIENVLPSYCNRELKSIELQFVEGTEAVLLFREDVIEMAKSFKII